MAKFLIDANLPYHFSIWKGPNFIHQYDLGDTWTDEEIWNYAKENNLTIVSKDADFSNRIVVSNPPPKVIHLKIGNMKLKELYAFTSGVWNEVVQLSKSSKLVSVYKDKIEGMER